MTEEISEQEKFNVPNIPPRCRQITLEIGTQAVLIDKLYGPSSACLLRIQWRSGDWVIERHHEYLKPDDPREHWEEMARFDAQESHHFDEPVKKKSAKKPKKPK